MSAPAAGLALAVLGPATVEAGRPLQTEDTTTVEPGAVEVTPAVDFVKTSRQRTVFPVVQTTSGLGPALDGHFDVNGFVTDRDGEPTSGGFAEVVVGFKYRLADETGLRPAVLVAVMLGARPKATQRELQGTERAADGVDVDARLAVSKTVSALTLTWNGGYAVAVDSDTTHAIRLGLSAQYAATAALALVGETFSEITFDHQAASVVLRAGAVYAITENVRVDGAVGVGLTRTSPEVTTTLGVTFRF